MLRCGTCDRLECFCTTRRPRYRGLRGEIIIVDEPVIQDDMPPIEQNAGTD